MSTKDEKARVELLQGTLDLLILRTLRIGPAHGHDDHQGDRADRRMTCCGWSRGRSIRRCTGCSSEAGSHFDHGTSDNNRRAKYYRLTPKGRRQLAVETSKWETLARAIARVLKPV